MRAYLRLTQDLDFFFVALRKTSFPSLLPSLIRIFQFPGFRLQGASRNNYSVIPSKDESCLSQPWAFSPYKSIPLRRPDPFSLSCRRSDDVVHNASLFASMFFRRQLVIPFQPLVSVFFYPLQIFPLFSPTELRWGWSGPSNSSPPPTPPPPSSPPSFLWPSN